jgi:HSP20 family protein
MRPQNNLPVKTFSDAIDSIFNYSMPAFLGSDFFQTQPSVNFSESDDAYIIELAAPGLNKEELSIDIKDGIIIIKGVKEESKNEEGPQYKRREFNYSSFTRSFTIPEDVKTDQISAKQENGILHIEMKKQDVIVKEGVKKIEIS